jgi:CRISPR/Cas system-associated exonuclease Cas4 (RecB family)
MVRDNAIDGVSYVWEPSEWPSAPQDMSWSQLTSLETCPRRWALSNASYEQIWDKKGYPRRNSIQQLKGLVVHNSIDALLTSLQSHGCYDPRSAEAVEILRGLGGYSEILHRAIENNMQMVVASPRMSLLHDHLQEKLENLIPDMRTIVSRKTALAYGSAGPLGVPDADGHERIGERQGRLSYGIHSEVRLRVGDIGWMGDADEIILTPDVCEIVDSKTGKQKQDHHDQLKTYAALWALDSVKNPEARLANRLTLSYDGEEVSVEVPDQSQIDQWVKDLESRTRAARKTLDSIPPPAIPSYENCSVCPVKQLCETYWDPEVQRSLTESPDVSTNYVDAQLKLVRKLDFTTYEASVESGMALTPNETIVLKSKSIDSKLTEGTRLRVNNVRLKNFEDEGRPKELALTRWSERFILGS